MTLDEKIGQMMQIDLGTVGPDPSILATYCAGSVLSGGDADPRAGNSALNWADTYDTMQVYALKTRLKIPMIYGVDADIRGHSDIKNRHEHVRRIAEIANIFLDAGMILIVTAVELTQAELFQTIVDPTKIVTILMGDPGSTDIQHELELKANQPPEESLPRILELLKENGFIGGFFDSAG